MISYSHWGGNPRSSAPLAQPPGANGARLRRWRRRREVLSYASRRPMGVRLLRPPHLMARDHNLASGDTGVLLLAGKPGPLCPMFEAKLA